jgi:hypothetical protein
MSDTSLQVMLRDFGEGLGLPDFGLDEYGFSSLVIDEILLNLETDESNESIMIYANVGKIPVEGSLEFYELLLEADFFSKGTAGATLGIDKRANIVILAYLLPTNGLSLHRFHRTIENFTNMAEWWSEKIAAFGSQEPTPERGPQVTPDMMA